MRVISYWKATRVIKHHGFHHQYADTVTSMAQSTLEISDFLKVHNCFFNPEYTKETDRVSNHISISHKRT